jgi:formate hydrogenlyase subunit 6/NADH:ubiquinone oxidoreductase subunit I
VDIAAGYPGWRFRSVGELCGDAGKAVEEVGDGQADRLIFALCRDSYSRNEFRARARRAGVDSFGMQIVELPASGAGSFNRAASVTAIRGAIARAGAYPGTQPENIKTVFSNGGGKISRRALFTIPPIEYRPVPTIAHSTCIAGSGCNQCEKACPHGALKNEGGSVRVDAAACPQRAVEFPGYSAEEIESHVDAIIAAGVADDGGDGAQNILFACSKSSRLPGDEWQVVPVACGAMVPAAALLSATAAGAGSVGVLRCKEQCKQNASPKVEGIIGYARNVLELAGDDPERVAILPPADSGAPLPAPSIATPPAARQEATGIFGRSAAAAALMALTEGSTSPFEPFVHDYSPIGVPVVDRASCTMCGTCAAVCPTGALRQTDEDGLLELSLDAASCMACDECVEACPEIAAGAIRLELRTDVLALTGGAVVLCQDEAVKCESCDTTFTSAMTLGRLEVLLGDAFTHERYGALCPECRTLSFDNPS